MFWRRARETIMFLGLCLFCVLFVASGLAADDGGKPAVTVLQPDPAWHEMGRNLWFDRKAKKVILRAGGFARRISRTFHVFQGNKGA